MMRGLRQRKGGREREGVHARARAFSPGARSLRGILAGVLLLAAAALFAVRPESIDYTCPFRAFTGYDCFSCGLTRSLHAASHGDLMASVQYHLMGPVIFAGILGLIAVWAFEAAAGRRIVRWNAAGKRVLITCSAAWLLFGAVRLIAQIFL